MSSSAKETKPRSSAGLFGEVAVYPAFRGRAAAFKRQRLRAPGMAAGSGLAPARNSSRPAALLKYFFPGRCGYLARSLGPTCSLQRRKSRPLAPAIDTARRLSAAVVSF